MRRRKTSPLAAHRGQVQPVKMRLLAIASLLCGEEVASRQQARWLARDRFLPAPVTRGGRGRAHEYDAAKVVAAAARKGDATPEQIARAFQLIDEIGRRQG